MSIQTQQMNVTPEQAHAWLDEHYKRLETKKFVQRPVTTSVVNRYAADMIHGSWLLGPQPIAFDLAGNLLDGQHRLEAVRKSRKTVPMMVSTGWPVNTAGNGAISTMDTIDRGKIRSVGQMMHLHGYVNANNYAACVASIGRLCWHATSCSSTLPGMLYVLDKLDMKSHIDRIVSRSADGVKDFKGRFIGPLAYYHTIAPKKAEAFAEDVFGFTAEKGSATQSYMRWTKTNLGRPTDDHLKALCTCIRAWHDNVQLSYVRIGQEAVAWLAAGNEKLRDQIRAALPRNK